MMSHAIGYSWKMNDALSAWKDGTHLSRFQTKFGENPQMLVEHYGYGELTVERKALPNHVQ